MKSNNLYIVLCWSFVNNGRKELNGIIDDVSSTNKVLVKKYLYEYLKNRFGEDKNTTIKWNGDRYIVNVKVNYKYASNDILTYHYKIESIPLEFTYKKLKKKFT